MDGAWTMDTYLLVSQLAGQVVVVLQSWVNGYLCVVINRWRKSLGMVSVRVPGNNVRIYALIIIVIIRQMKHRQILITLITLLLRTYDQAILIIVIIIHYSRQTNCNSRELKFARIHSPVLALSSLFLKLAQVERRKGKKAGQRKWRRDMHTDDGSHCYAPLCMQKTSFQFHTVLRVTAGYLKGVSTFLTHHLIVLVFE